MIDQRSAVKELYDNPIFKSKFWSASEVFNENTPLLKKNIDNVLHLYTSYSSCYETFYDYMKECTTKAMPQVVGLNSPGMSHWIAVEYRDPKFLFIDSSGAPLECYYINKIPDLPPRDRIVATECGHIRQSPKAATCGIYALFYCMGYALEHNGYKFWSNHAPKTVDYEPCDMKHFVAAYTRPEVEYYLYSNDINMYNFYKMLDGSD